MTVKKTPILSKTRRAYILSHEVSKEDWCAAARQEHICEPERLTGWGGSKMSGRIDDMFPDENADPTIHENVSTWICGYKEDVEAASKRRDVEIEAEERKKLAQLTAKYGPQKSI